MKIRNFISAVLCSLSLSASFPPCFVTACLGFENLGGHCLFHFIGNLYDEIVCVTAVGKLYGDRGCTLVEGEA
jgi:hypothetical protein